MSQAAFMNIKTISGSVAATRMGRAIPVKTGAPARTAFAIPITSSGPIVRLPPTDTSIIIASYSNGLFVFELSWIKPVGSSTATWTLYGVIDETPVQLATGTTAAEVITPSGNPSYFGYYFTVYATYPDASTSSSVESVTTSPS
jgi:hypothetical protein